MSRKRNKKKSSQNCKQLNAERRNYFLKYIKYILLESGCEKVLHALSGNEQKALYTIRQSSLKVRHEECACLSKEDVTRLCQFIDNEFHVKEVNLGESGFVMSIKEFYTYGICLFILQKWMEENPSPKRQEAVQVMQERLDLINVEQNLRRTLIGMCSTIAMIASSFDGHIVKVISNMSEPSGSNHSSCMEIIVSAVPYQQKKIKLYGNCRPAYRVGSFAYHFIYPEWVNVKRSLFEKPTPFNETEIPVYIQKHAMNRLTERLDSLSRDVLELYVYTSFQNPKVRFFKGKVLVDYIYATTKLGYLLVELVDNVVLIKTFLLLTNDATPEGEKLKELSGLSKIDRKYWNIDRLSTFQKTDIVENDELRILFEKAGCKKLFSSAVNFLEDKEHSQLAQNLLEYMHPPTTNGFLD